MTKPLIRDKAFFSTLFVLALPIAFQNLINTLLNALDNIMIGSLGSSAIAAVGFANQIFLVLATMLFGICTACGIFTAQFYGKKDYENIKRSIALNIVGVFIFSSIFAVIAFFFPESLLGLFTKDLTVIDLGSQYMKFIALSYVPMALSFAFSSAMRTIGKSYIPLCVSVLVLIVNGLLNYMLIFGVWGAPKMGVAGAALATVIARIIEFILLGFILYTRFEILQARFKHLFSISRSFLKKFITTTAPVVANEAMWSVGIAIYAAIFGHLSTETVAAVNITKVLENLMLVFFQGIGSAAGIMIGHKIGENKIDTAIDYANIFTKIVPIASILFSALMIILRPAFLSFYNVEPEIMQLTYSLILISAIIIPFKCLNYVHIVGTLRSGGDTIACLIIDIIGVWGVSIPLMLISGPWLGLDVRIVYICSLSEEIVKAVIVIWRVNGRKWIRNLVKDI